MKVAIGCDHIVTEVKDHIFKYLTSLGHEVIDCGTYNKERTHYPIFGHKVASCVALNKVDRGIVICGTGVGISNSANKTKNIRAVLVKDIISAKQAVEEFDINVIAFGGRITGIGLIEEISKVFLETKYNKKLNTEKRIKRINNLINLNNYDSHIFDKENKKWEAGFYKD